MSFLEISQVAANLATVLSAVIAVLALVAPFLALSAEKNSKKLSVYTN